MHEARSYVHLAASYTLPPCVIATIGLPASGKSWASRAAAEPFEAAVLRSDVIRKQLAGLEPTERVSEADRLLIYSSEFSKRIYEQLFIRADEREVCDADRAVYRAMKERFEPPIELPPAQVVTVTPDFHATEATAVVIERLIASAR